MDKKKILITGGCGFIGSHVVSLLADSPHDLYVLDNLSVGKADAIPLERVELYVGDIRSKEAYDYVQQVKPDYLIHLAAQTNVQQSIAGQKFDADVNIVGTLNMIEACLKVVTFQKLIFASTAAVYGDNMDLPLTEESNTSPTSPYGQAKKTVESYLSLAHKNEGLPFVVLRFANVYGYKVAGGNDVISNFFSGLLEGKAPLIYGDGEQTRDFIYILDIAQALIEAMELADSGIYNVSTNEQISVNNIFEIVSQIMGTSCKAEMLPARVGDIRNSRLANDKFVRDTQWQPTYLIQAGLSDMWHKKSQVLI